MQESKGLSTLVTKALNLPQSSVIAMVAIAAIGISTGFISYNSEAEQLQASNTLDAQLPEIPKDQIKANKYDNANLSTDKATDSTFFSQTYGSLEEKQKKENAAKQFGIASNEDLSIEEIARKNGVREPVWQNREDVRKYYSQQLDQTNNQNKHTISQITKPAALSAHDIAERRSRDEALERAARMEQMAVSQMENLNREQQRSEPYSLDAYSLDPDSDMSANTSESERSTYAHKSGTAHGSIAITPVTVANLDKYVEVPKETAHQNSFYGLKGERKKPEMVAAQPVPNSIEAVIHGDADNVTVTNGSTIKLRLLQDIQVGKFILPKNSILSGECGISGERVHVMISSIRIQSSIIPVKLMAYDIDGHAGIYVPNMAVKQQIAQTGSQTVSGGSINMPYMVPTGANVGEMVVGQTASQGVNLAINGARSLASRKISQQKAIIRPNYRIYLKQEQN
ncbi:conjugative transposon protein TraM [Xanthocytophaga flava]|uniref:conjugative transposon protein TraM n=1 Tax=Xanthocytophaga flava TaxID=3048013 RepID=UPI0028D7A521|nr:conjugative transposon protein TraM [Xanthocytophaga flavus]MDJ1470221.1 conjugative transposon protein TraM [Xanthocytophaga flavus]